MIRNFDDICNSVAAKVDQYQEKHGVNPENWKQHAKVDPALKFLRKLNHTYHRAQANAVRFGYVGVGCISFAEGRIIRYQERLARKLA